MGTIQFGFDNGLLFIGDKLTGEINLCDREIRSYDEEKSELPHSKLSAGVSRIISEKNELHVKYDRLLKDYELARHECKQKDTYIKELEEKQEKLLKELLTMKSEVENVREENKHILKSYKDSEEKLFAIKEIVSGN